VEQISWPAGKTCAFAFSVDDIHPGTSRDCYEAGGDGANGALGVLDRLMQKHDNLRITLFVTADWREISPYPDSFFRYVPWVRDRVFLTSVLPKGTMAIDRHPEFTNYLRQRPRFELAHHGLHHVHRGLQVPVEFQHQNANEITDILLEAARIFDRAGLCVRMGLQPPAWNTPDALVQACKNIGIKWLCGARDISTSPKIDAKSAMSGPKNQPVLLPGHFDNGLIHFCSNFQATSPVERATSILDAGGLLAIKGHISKRSKFHYALDGIDDLYCNYLDALITILDTKYGDNLWWTTFDEISEFLHKTGQTKC
jgi:hypothetical protein